MSRGNDHGAEIVARLDEGRNHGPVGIDAEGVPVRPVVDEDAFVFNFDLVSPHADDPFDVVFGAVLGIDENDNVASLRIGDWNQNVPQERDLDAVNKFVDEQMVADQKRRNHGPGGDLVGLNDERADHNGDQDGDDDDFNDILDF